MTTQAGRRIFSRMMTGESIFLNQYIAEGGNGMIAFASCIPGTIEAVEIWPDQPVIVQKTGFLACTEGVELTAAFTNLSVGFFGGEGFIMQRLSGRGTAFIEIDGAAVDYDLQPGQSIVVDTGRVAMMSAGCSMQVQSVKGLKNVLFGGEGLFNTIITGPGHVVLQTMPLSGLAAALRPFFPPNSN